LKAKDQKVTKSCDDGLWQTLRNMWLWMLVSVKLHRWIILFTSKFNFH